MLALSTHIRAGAEPAEVPQLYMVFHLKTSIWQKTALVVAVRLPVVDATCLGCHLLIAGRGEECRTKTMWCLAIFSTLFLSYCWRHGWEGWTFDLPMAVFWSYHHWLFILLVCLLISRVVLFYSISSFWALGEHMHVLSEVTVWFSFPVTWK